MKHDKIELAGELIEEAASECLTATSRIGYAKSILLSGAVVGIIHPHLRHLEVSSLHGELADFAAELDGVTANERPKAVRLGVHFYKNVYNSLKHSGGYNHTLADDRHLEANLEDEAYHLVGCALTDYNRLMLQQGFSDAKLSNNLRSLLGSPWPPRNAHA